MKKKRVRRIKLARNAIENLYIAGVKKFEEMQNKVVLYFTELSNEPVCVPFTINENVIVDNKVETIVTLFDYYKPEMKVSKVSK